MPDVVTIPSGAEAAFETKDQFFPAVSDDVFDKMIDAPPWKDEFNEEDIFEAMYQEAAAFYYAAATATADEGETLLGLFQKWKPFVGQFVRHSLRGDVDNPLDATLNWDAEGAGQAIVRPINEATWDDNGSSYFHTPGAAGDFDWIPDTGAAAVETADANEQAFVIIGHIDFANGGRMGYDYVQATVNDDLGTRRPEYLIGPNDGEDTLKVWDRRRGPLVVEPGFTLDYDMNVEEANITNGLWPLGFEVIRADNGAFGGIQDA